MSSTLDLQSLGTLPELVHTLFAVCGWLRESPRRRARLQVRREDWPWASRVAEPRLLITTKPVEPTRVLSPTPDTEDTPLAHVFAAQLGADPKSARPPKLELYPEAPQIVLSVTGLPLQVRDRLIEKYRGRPLFIYDGTTDVPAGCTVARPADFPDARLLDVVASAELVIAGENKVIDFALLAQRPFIGLFSRRSARRRLGIGRVGASLVPACAGYPCGHSPGCEGPALGVFSCANDIVPHHIDGCKPGARPSIIVREPATDILAVMPFLSAGGGERSTLTALRGIQRLRPETRISVVVTARNTEAEHFRPLFAPLLHAEISGDPDRAPERLSAVFHALKPRSILFYNNDLVVRALHTGTWRPERCAFVVHTLFAPGEYGLLNDPRADAVVSRVIAVSENTAEHIVRRGLVLSPKVLAVRNALEPLAHHGRVERRRRLGIPDDEFVVGYLGRMDDAKGVDSVLQASRDAPPGVSYLLVGWGDLYSRAEAAACRGVRVVPADHDVAPWFSAMDLCVLPTHTEGGVPYVLMECLSVGTPMAVTPVSDVPRLFTHRESILTIDTTPASVASAVRWAVKHRAELKMIGERGRQIIEREFAVDAMAGAYYDVLLGEPVI